MNFNFLLDSLALRRKRRYESKHALIVVCEQVHAVIQEKFIHKRSSIIIMDICEIVRLIIKDNLSFLEFYLCQMVEERK